MAALRCETERKGTHTAEDVEQKPCIAEFCEDAVSLGVEPSAEVDRADVYQEKLVFFFDSDFWRFFSCNEFQFWRSEFVVQSSSFEVYAFEDGMGVEDYLSLQLD